MTLSRRRFWSYAAPAIVLAPSLMRVSAAALVKPPTLTVGGYDLFGQAIEFDVTYGNNSIYFINPGLIRIRSLDALDALASAKYDWMEAATVVTADAQPS